MTDTTALLARLEALETRLARVEDERAIVNLLASYGPLVDSGAEVETSEVWAADGVYDVEGHFMDGRGAVQQMVLSEGHQGLIHHGSAHFNGPVAVFLDDADRDKARAVCHSLLILRNSQGRPFVARAGAHLFALTRTAEGWKVQRRTSRQLDGAEIGRALLRSGVTGRDLPEGH